jgi:hypothetical protein
MIRAIQVAALPLRAPGLGEQRTPHKGYAWRASFTAQKLLGKRFTAVDGGAAIGVGRDSLPRDLPYAMLFMQTTFPEFFSLLTQITFQEFSAPL